MRLSDSLFERVVEDSSSRVVWACVRDSLFLGAYGRGRVIKLGEGDIVFVTRDKLRHKGASLSQLVGTFICSSIVNCVCMFVHVMFFGQFSSVEVITDKARR